MIPLLPVAQEFWGRRNDSPASWIFLIVLGAVAVIAMIVNAVKAATKGGGVHRLASAPSSSKSSFMRAARRRGIPDQDAVFLHDFAKALGTLNPEFVFQNTQKLDAFFRDAFNYIDKRSESEAVAEEGKARLFSIREGITQRALLGAPISSTRELDRNTTLSIVTPDDSIRPSVVRVVESGGLGVERPLDEYGDPIRVGRGTKLTVFFYRKAHQGYTFTTHAAGYQEIEGSTLLVLRHSDSIRPLPARTNLRREIDAPCRFSQVRQEPARGKQARRLVVDSLEIRGTIVDISAGGCAVKSATNFAPGALLKITFEAADGIQTALASVVRVTALSSGCVLHVRFARISKKAVNAVLSWVYGYAE